MNQVGVRAFVALYPLTKEGAHIRIWPSINRDVPESKKGKIVFVPSGQVALFPIDLFHAGGFRTGPVGNLRVHVYAFLVPRSLSKKDRSLVLPKQQVNEYLGLAQNDTSTLSIVPVETNPSKVQWLDKSLKQLLDMFGF